ncbi:MAG: HlyD family efflux transporter periplasmic adaptor subunit [Bacteroidetes bacterium]|nr:HlyD family efflux transporter periplasmic adaptor subunit [Bacteroidota bacterium]
MKNSISILILLLFVIIACKNEQDKPDAYGTFEATEITVSSQANGQINRFLVEEGQLLDSGQIVGMIDTTDLHLKKAQVIAQRSATASQGDNLETQIAVQEQNKENILVDKARLVKMFKDGAATRKQLDDINGSLNLIDKQIAAIRSQNNALYDQVESFTRQIEQIKKSINDARIINPVKGTVLAKFAEPDEITTYGKPLYKIADMTAIFLRVYIGGTQLPHIKLGQKVGIRYDKDEKTNTLTEGIVSWISQAAEFTPKTIQTKEERVNLVYAVKIRVKNDGSMKIGMPGEMKLVP